MLTSRINKSLIAITAITTMALATVFAPALKAIGEQLNEGDVFLVAENGAAFEMTIREDSIRKAKIETAFPVAKAFGKSSDGTRLLYESARDDLPTGKLYLEDLTTKEIVQITDKVVMSARMSPTDDSAIAFTFAGGSGFGLSLVSSRSGSENVLVEDGVEPETFAWDASGDRVVFAVVDADDQSVQQGLNPAAQADTARHASYKAVDVKSFEVDDAPTEIPTGLPIIESKLDDQITLSSMPRPPTHHRMYYSPDRAVEIEVSEAAAGGAIFAGPAPGGEKVRLGSGTVAQVLNQGVLIREFEPSGSTLKYVTYSGVSYVIATVTVTYNLPLAALTVTQGGASYASPGNCNLYDHSGLTGYAYDFQSSTSGAHAMVMAPGLVVYVKNDVTCNSCDASGCPDYSSNCASNGGWGNAIIIEHADGSWTKLTHLQASSIQVAVGNTVCQGRYIGRQGHTGCSIGNMNGCGDHVHAQRQNSSALSGQSIAITFADAASNPLRCSTYTSGSVEVTSCSQGSNDLSNGVPVSGTLQRGQTANYRINVPAGMQLLHIEMSGSGDADLYTRKGQPPTLTVYDCRPYATGSNESCDFGDPLGFYYIMIYGFSTTSSYTLRATYSGGTPAGTVNVVATLDYNPYSGPMTFSIERPTSRYNGTSVPLRLTNQPAGSYSLINVQSPSGTFVGTIGPSVFQSLAPGGSITWTVSLHSTQHGLLAVRAKLDGNYYTGPINMSLSGPRSSPVTYTPTIFTDRLRGTYTLSYNSGGPANARFINITPSPTQTLGSSDIEFVVNFATNSGGGDAWDPADNTSGNGTPLGTPAATEQSHGPHSLGTTDTYDWFRFTLNAGESYNFNSIGGTGDTFGELYYNPAGSPVAIDDDAGGGYMFSMNYTPSTAGTYYLRVRAYSIGSACQYNLKYRKTSGGVATPLAWEFNTNGNFQSWNAINVSSASVNTGIAFLDPAGADPYFQGPAISVSGSVYRYATVRLASNLLDGNGYVYFKTSNEPYFSETKKVAFHVSNCALCGNAAFLTYTVDMWQSSRWAGQQIIGIRIDPGDNGQAGTNRDSVGFDYIRLSQN